MVDIPRPELKRRKRLRQTAFGIVAVAVLVVVTVALSRLEPAAPSVARASVWVDTVREGEMLRQVRGPGTLQPREIRWIAAQTDGRVDRIVVRPGAVVEPDTVLVELSNADLQQQTEEARYQVEQAEAEYADAELKLKSQQLDQRAALGAARTEYETQRVTAEAQKDLADEGIVPAIDYRRTQLLAEQWKQQVEIEEERLAQFSASVDAQLSLQRARVDQARNAYDRRLAQVESLNVRAGLAGIVREVSIEEGQRVALGANIARVYSPDELMAELRIPETQARDVQIGQRVDVDTRNGVVEGRVTRIDPAVESGTVQVDVDLVGELPRGARPDLSVDGTIEIERLPRVVYTGRCVYCQRDSTVSLFKLETGGDSAVRVPVQIGRTSVNAVEIVQGLGEGDQVILSDTSEWDDYDRIRLN
jgi:HlyD family secretion protein